MRAPGRCICTATAGWSIFRPDGWPEPRSVRIYSQDDQGEFAFSVRTDGEFYGFERTVSA